MSHFKSFHVTHESMSPAILSEHQSPGRENTAAGAVQNVPPSFEEAMRELDAIVARMEDGTLSLEASLAAYKRGAEIVKQCQATLESVREQVQVLDGELLKPLAGFADKV